MVQFSHCLQDYYEDYGSGSSLGGLAGGLSHLLGGAAAGGADKTSRRCLQYGDSVRALLRQRHDLWRHLPDKLRPRLPDFGQEMTNGCPGFAEGILIWPEEMIVGGRI